jgi:thiol-disulfide isomerase/thioredoxin
VKQINNFCPFSLKDTAGHIVRSADFKGKYLLLDFWASWCGPCRANNPVLKKIVDKYRHSKFELVSISMDDNADKRKAAINKDSMNWINISDLKALNSNVVIEYGISAYPTYILIDPKGKVILRTENEIDRIEEKLETIFE